LKQEAKEIAMTEDSLTISASPSKSPLKFFLLVFVLSLPFLLAGTLIPLQVLPGIPVSGFAFLCPVIAAVILVYQESKYAGVKNLLKRAFDFKRVRVQIWYVPVILLMPCIMALSYGAIRLMGGPLPAPQFSVGTMLVLLVAFFIGALGEELGWSGYAIDPLQERFGALWGALLIGVVWAVWHYVGLLEVHRSLAFIAWWSLGTVASRVIIVWLYNNTGKSVFVAALFHAMINLTWQLFPINGSYYDPRVTGLITTLVAVAVVIVWGSRTLVRVSQIGVERRA
jgi:membrane protease YdiL (CAAX protease family)